MQAKQHIMKNRTHIHSETRFTRDFFVDEGFLAENVQKLQFLLIQ